MTEPTKSWSWHVTEDPGLGCAADKSVTASAGGLEYSGFCYHPNWGGAYTIGAQTVAEYLERGPLAEQLPDELAAEIRTWLLAHA